jgi:hypothetical protein
MMFSYLSNFLSYWNFVGIQIYHASNNIISSMLLSNSYNILASVNVICSDCSSLTRTKYVTNNLDLGFSWVISKMIKVSDRCSVIICSLHIINIFRISKVLIFMYFKILVYVTQTYYLLYKMVNP